MISLKTRLATAARRSLVWLPVACLALIAGCAKLPITAVTPLRPANLAELRTYLLSHKPDVDQFRVRGPFDVTVAKDREIRLSASERYVADLYLSASAEKAPLVILLHGDENSKDDHAYQAMHLATWGLNALSLDMPNKGPWIANGRVLARIVRHIRSNPEVIDPHVDASRIVLAGHSFGGAAVAIALADGAPAAGGVLLDPAGLGREMFAPVRKVARPVMVIASDQQVTRTRERGVFYELIRSDIAEVAVRGAAHDDAEFSMDAELEEYRVTFLAALTSAAFSLGLTGKLDYAWASYQDSLRRDQLFDALRK